MHITKAVAADASPILALRHAAEDWLAAQGIDQWRRREVPLSVIDEQVGRGEFFVARIGSETPVIGALRLLWSDPAIWGSDDTVAGYVHGLVIDRSYAGRGVGAQLLEWAAERAREAGASVLRLDCAETNPNLRTYYLRHGFLEVGRRDFEAEYFSVTLFEKTLTR